MTIGLVAVSTLVAFASVSAQHWTKVDVPEAGHHIEVPDGTWHVSMDDKDVCYVGQDWWRCIDELTAEWSYACAERALDADSKLPCDKYYDVTQAMKATGAGRTGMVTTGLGRMGRLPRRENTTVEWVVDQHEKSHEAACYLGFLGECKWSEVREG